MSIALVKVPDDCTLKKPTQPHSPLPVSLPAGIFLTDIGKGRGLSVEQGTQLLAVMYGCNVVGRGCVGLLQILGHLSAQQLLGGSLGCCGVAAFGFSLLDHVGEGERES